MDISFLVYPNNVQDGYIHSRWYTCQRYTRNIKKKHENQISDIINIFGFSPSAFYDKKESSCWQHVAFNCEICKQGNLYIVMVILPLFSVDWIKDVLKDQT